MQRRLTSEYASERDDALGEDAGARNEDGAEHDANLERLLTRALAVLHLEGGVAVVPEHRVHVEGVGVA